MMTHAEAVNLKSFKNYCNCGGAHWQMNGRSEAQPHLDWCPQREEYAEWYKAMQSAPEGGE